MSIPFLKGKGDLEGLSTQPVANPKDQEDALKAIEKDYREAHLRLATAHKSLPKSVQPWFFSESQKLNESIDEAFTTKNNDKVRDVLAGFEALVTEAAPLSKNGWAEDREWIFPFWSDRFNCEVWFVYSEKEADFLMQKGVLRGFIFTEDEIKKLSKLNQSSFESIDQIKQTFNATLIGIKDDRPESKQVEPPPEETGSGVA